MIKAEFGLVARHPVQVRCRDLKWRTSEQMMRDQVFPECELCGDEVRRIRGESVLIKWSMDPRADHTHKYKIYCCLACAELALDNKYTHSER